MTRRLRLDAPTCQGPLVLHEIPADGRREATALLECASCGPMTLPVDERHVWTPMRTTTPG